MLHQLSPFSGKLQINPPDAGTAMVRDQYTTWQIRRKGRGPSSFVMRELHNQTNSQEFSVLFGQSTFQMISLPQPPNRLYQRRTFLAGW